jgi:hypothetical protein
MKKLAVVSILLACGLASPALAQSSGPTMGFFSGVPAGTRIECTSRGKARCCRAVSPSYTANWSCATHASEEQAAGRNPAAWRR